MVGFGEGEGVEVDVGSGVGFWYVGSGVPYPRGRYCSHIAEGL